MICVTIRLNYVHIKYQVLRMNFNGCMMDIIETDELGDLTNLRRMARKLNIGSDLHKNALNKRILYSHKKIMWTLILNKLIQIHISDLKNQPFLSDVSDPKKLGSSWSRSVRIIPAGSGFWSRIRILVRTTKIHPICTFYLFI